MIATSETGYTHTKHVKGKTMKAKVVLLACAGAMAGLAFAAPAPAEKSPAEKVKAARAAFEKENGAAFQKTTLVDREAADDAARFDKAQGRTSWTILLPYSDDSRVRFVKAEFDGGAFASGELLVFGQRPKALDAAAFAALRGKFPMVAVRTDAGAPAGIAALYPAGDAASVKVMPSITYSNGDFDPVAHVLGALGSSDATKRLGISCDGLKYSVAFVGGDGERADLGVAQAKGGWRVTGVVPGKETTERLRALVARRGKTTADRVSDKDVVDYWLTGTYEIKGGK